MECRLLGPIVDKETTAPKYGALSLNALLHALNQELSLDPLIDPDTDQVRDALHSLKGRSLARCVSSADSQVVQVQALAAGPTESFDGTAVE